MRSGSRQITDEVRLGGTGNYNIKILGADSIYRFYQLPGKCRLTKSSSSCKSLLQFRPALLTTDIIKNN